MKKLSAVNDMIKGPMFAAVTTKDGEFLKKNTVITHIMIYAILGVLFIGSFAWIFFRAYTACTTGLHSMEEAYFEIDFESTRGVAIAISTHTFMCFWMGIGHFALDLLVASYYMQAVGQLRMIKYNLQHLFDDNKKHSRHSKYLDETDEDIQKRFVDIIQRHSKVVWLLDQVSQVFGFGIASHFFLTTFMMCFSVYDASLNMQGSAFLFYLFVIVEYNQQNLIYCYFGSLLESESDTMNCAVYSSDWTSVSPRFRRLILIAMCRWHKSIAIRVGGVIPLSLETFVSVCKLTYSMYTVLATMNT